MKKIFFFSLLLTAAFAANSQVRTTRWEVKIPSLWCEACELTIESRMLRYDGITEIDAKWRAKKAVIRYIPDRIDTSNIKAFIAALGFDTDEEKADEGQRKLLPECCQKPPPPKGKPATAVAPTTTATTATTAATPTPTPTATTPTPGAKPATPAIPAGKATAPKPGTGAPAPAPKARTKATTPATKATPPASAAPPKGLAAPASAKPTTAKPAAATSATKPVKKS